MALTKTEAIDLKTWNITLLKVGGYTVSASTIIVGSGSYMLELPAWAIAVYDDNTKILIDTGVHDEKWVNDNVEIFSMPEDEYLPSAIEKHLGWKPEDVDIVINTHLHYDHCGNNQCFKNAQFYVQRKEWDFAFDPITTQKYIYPCFLFDKTAVNYTSWVFVEGEATVLPGIVVFPTPGHTAGHQSVLITTDEGIVCATGDACNIAGNLLNNEPPGIIASTPDALKSFEEIRKRAHYFIPGHDPEQQDLQQGDFHKTNQ